MNESELDCRLRRWMAEREPDSVPATLRARARLVPHETAVPVAWRVRDVFVRPAAAALGGGPAIRAAVVLLLLGLAVAASIAALLLGGSNRHSTVPGVERWGAFVVGRPAPTVVMQTMPGAASDGDDNTLEFEDLTGSVVVIMVPSLRGPDLGARDLAELAEARRLTDSGVVFLVGARSASVMDGLANEGGPPASGIGAVDLSVGGESTIAFPEGDAALVVVDRHGAVAAAFAGSLPGRNQLLEVIQLVEARQ